MCTQQAYGNAHYIRTSWVVSETVLNDAHTLFLLTMDEERGTRNENLVANKKENPMDTRDEKLSTLIDTLEYIEARQSLPVPNHLLETSKMMLTFI